MEDNLSFEVTFILKKDCLILTEKQMKLGAISNGIANMTFGYQACI